MKKVECPIRRESYDIAGNDVGRLAEVGGRMGLLLPSLMLRIAQGRLDIA